MVSDLAITGSRLEVTAVCPGAVDTAIHASSRNRPDVLAAGTSLSGARVIDAVREERFLVLSTDAYRDALASRAESLAAGDLPPLAAFE